MANLISMSAHGQIIAKVRKTWKGITQAELEKTKQGTKKIKPLNIFYGKNDTDFFFKYVISAGRAICKHTGLIN